jgi:hypothetical protein
MVLLDFSMTPLGKGECVRPYVARCLEVVAASGLDHRLHAMGNTPARRGAAAATMVGWSAQIGVNHRRANHLGRHSEGRVARLVGPPPPI